MTKPHILQVGRYPAGDQSALKAAFDMRRYFEAPDKAAFLATKGPAIRGIATRGGLGASAEIIAVITATTSLYCVILNRRGAPWA